MPPAPARLADQRLQRLQQARSRALATSACRFTGSREPQTALLTCQLHAISSAVMTSFGRMYCFDCCCSRTCLFLPPSLFRSVQVAGVSVGHCTIIHGEGEEAVRTGVTAVLPRGLAARESSCYAGWFSMNGCGELTGMPWVEESGIATGPYMITGTGSVGLVHDAVMLWAHRRGDVGLPGGGESTAL